MSSSRFPFPLPYGWYCVGFSDELASGQALPLRYFGRELVLFRTESGRACLLDAYCPHLGAHLGHGIHEHKGKGGEVRGETIVCPFHGWRFNGDGYCEEVPYARTMPPRVKDRQALGSWPVVEENRAIWAWYHPQGEAPSFQVKPVPETTSPDWTEPEIHRWRIRTHPQEMAENGSDPAHFRYVHGTDSVPEPNYMEYDGPEYRAETVNVLNTPRGQVTSVFGIYSNGPGQALSTFRGLCDTLLQGLVTPIDEEWVQVQFAFQQLREQGEGRSNVGRALIRDICKQLEEDKPIWEHKRYNAQPILCDGDGPIARFRRWYSQFYVQ